MRNITIQVPSKTSNAVYDVKEHDDGSWSCSCPAWRNQSADPMHRRCKHMDQVVTDLGGHVVGVYNLAQARS